MRLGTRNIYYLAFVVSGFSGLIYESVWTHYLKNYLGHAAYAQALVLAIYMGGIAAGSWFAGQVSGRWNGPLKLYALAEGAIGVFALVFHELFLAATTLSYDFIIPSLTTPWSADIFKWGTAALLIFPQSLLLGMTFPFMTSGVLRKYPDKPGEEVGFLYFANSIGAACGVLVSAFVLIRLFGLPGTIRIAGVINLMLAVLVWKLAGHERVGRCQAETVVKAEAAGSDTGYYGFLLAAFVTGMASFIYEIGWIRLLSLVLGSSTHSFELMVCAFILGLALGALWVQRRIDHIANRIGYLARVQIFMGFGALSSLLVYNQTFEFMRWFINLVEKTERGYTLFSLVSNGIALGVMLPTTFCAGMTLPLITTILLKKGAGERSIGAVYAANTLGAIGGVFVAIHLLIPITGLKNLIITGSSLDLLLGVYLLWIPIARYGKQRLVLTAVVLVSIGSAVFLVDFDYYKMASGVFRKGKLLTEERLNYYRDGKTASISVTTAKDGWRSIRSNGKPDASIMMVGSGDGRTSSDEATQVLLGAVPLALLPEARTAAVIGLGSGVTANTLLNNPEVISVDTIEIEPAVIEAARLFSPFNDLLYTDSRSRLHVEDAKTFFSAGKKQYDLIISEPSNPWVSGVSSLFSSEFYRHINRHLTDQGLFVQWVQLYEMDYRLVASILKAVSANFADYAVYSSTDNDMMIVAGKRANDWIIGDSIFRNPRIVADLGRINIHSRQDFMLRRLGTKAIIEPLLATIKIRPNSDFYPVLDQNAERSRFLRETAEGMFYYTCYPIPLQEIMSPQKELWAKNEITPSIWFKRSKDVMVATGIRNLLVSGRNYGGVVLAEEDRVLALKVRDIFMKCSADGEGLQQVKVVHEVMQRIIPYLSGNEFTAMAESLQQGNCTSSQLRKLMAFLVAASSREPDIITAAAARFLEDRDSYPTELQRYAVSWAMAGYIAKGKRQDARKLLEEYGTQFPPANESDLFIRFVTAAASKDTQLR